MTWTTFTPKKKLASEEQPSYSICLRAASELTDEELEQCLGLIEQSSKADYSRSRNGWNPKAKKKEMKLLDLKYLLVREETEDERRARERRREKSSDGFKVMKSGNLKKVTMSKSECSCCGPKKPTILQSEKDKMKKENPSPPRSPATQKLIDEGPLPDVPISPGFDKSQRGEQTLADTKAIKSGMHSPQRYPAGEGPILAFLSMMPTVEDGTDVLYLYEIHLSPQLRGSGLGSFLMSRFEGAAEAIHGVEKTMLTVFTSNEKAVEFYQKRGYEVDPFSPEPRKTRSGRGEEGGYVILSKTVPKGEEEFKESCICDSSSTAETLRKLRR
jgi:ribosomal protein S18 acetylase RimI-like enzyme